MYGKVTNIDGIFFQVTKSDKESSLVALRVLVHTVKEAYLVAVSWLTDVIDNLLPKSL